MLVKSFSKIRLYKIAQKTMTKDINFLISQRGALRLGGYMSILYIFIYCLLYTGRRTGEKIPEIKRCLEHF